MSSSPITFTGQSTFSSSFQQVLQRAVSIASLPMQEVEIEIGKLQGQQTDLSNLQSSFSSLQNAVQAISTAMSGSVSASSSQPSVVTAFAQSNTLPGTYSIQVTDTGSSTTTISNPSTQAVTDPASTNISSSLNYNLTVNGVSTQLTLANGNLDALAAAINNSTAGVSATIVNLGSNASPDYRLAIASKELGPDTIQLNDGTSDLLSNVTTGTDAQYSLNGSSTVLSSTSDQVTLAPGLTANMLSASPGQTVTVTVAASEATLANALSNFASAYNSASSALASETGQNGGALAGQSLVYGLQAALRQIAQYSTGSSAPPQSMTDLGLSLGSDGTLSFDSSQFNGLSSSSIQQFLGGLTSGGFLQTANSALDSFTNASTGVLTNQFNTIVGEITNDQNQVSDDQNRVNLIQANLMKQLTAADAAISVLQQQNTFYTNLFQTENANHMAGLY